MKLTKIDMHSNGYIFRGLCKRGKSFRLGEKYVHISYVTARENVLDDLNRIGLNRKKIGLHTLREKCPNTKLFLVRIFLYSD